MAGIRHRRADRRTLLRPGDPALPLGRRADHLTDACAASWRSKIVLSALTLCERPFYVYWTTSSTRLSATLDLRPVDAALTRSIGAHGAAGLRVPSQLALDKRRLAQILAHRRRSRRTGILEPLLTAQRVCKSMTATGGYGSFTARPLQE